ncbi:MAG: nuclear transport factor 2 family protein [Pseudomonadota bacterium]
MVRYLSGILLSSVIGSNTAMPCSEASTAIQYLNAIDDMDWERMASHLSESAVYVDPTMIHYDRDAIRQEGREEIIEFWSGESDGSGTSDIEYTVASCMETAGYHVVNLDIDIEVAGEFWNVNQERISIPGRVVSIIRIEDDRVTEHRDYVEYSAADRRVSELQKQYGTASPD